MRYMCVPLCQQSTPSSYLYVVIFAPSPLRRVLSVSCALNTNLDIRIFECFFLLSFALLLLLLFLLLLMARVAVTFLFTSFGDLIFLFSAFFSSPEQSADNPHDIWVCRGKKWAAARAVSGKWKIMKRKYEIAESCFATHSNVCHDIMTGIFRKAIIE